MSWEAIVAICALVGGLFANAGALSFFGGRIYQKLQDIEDELRAGTARFDGIDRQVSDHADRITRLETRCETYHKG